LPRVHDATGTAAGRELAFQHVHEVERVDGDDHGRDRDSHWNGYQVDISPTACVRRYTKRNVGGNRWRSAVGNVHFDGGGHRDITYH
jgi:hypothetical protein